MFPDFELGSQALRLLLIIHLERLVVPEKMSRLKMLVVQAVDLDAVSVNVKTWKSSTRCVQRCDAT